jgi:hypothetical protein
MILTSEIAKSGFKFDTSIGNIPDLWFGDLHPYHVAHWYGTQDKNLMLPAVERRLAGDFFCMPFGKSDLVDDPQHGFTSNTDWLVRGADEGFLHAELGVPVMGAKVEKTLRLHAGQPFLYQTHTITGGQGQVTLAHHPNVRMAAGGRLSFSPKRTALSPDAPLVAGRNWLPLATRSTNLNDFAGIDLQDYPTNIGHEDFICLVEAAGSTLGWTALVRKSESDIILVMKEAAVLPVTMLWYSNGGREYAPWNGQHIGVLGIEDGIAAGADNPVAREGVATNLTLGGVHVIRHVLGALPCPKGWTEIKTVKAKTDRLTLVDVSGKSVDLPFDGAFFPAMS